jgi:hypothetical protein
MESVSFGLRYLECWAKGDDGHEHANGPFEIYLDEKLYIRGQKRNGKAVGMWYSFDREGDVVDACDYSVEADCVLTE